MVAGPAAPITTLHCQHCQAEVLDLGVDGRYVVQATLTAPAWTFTSAMQGGTAACPACQEPISAGQRVGLWYRLDGKDARTYHAACAPSVAPEVV